MVSIPAWLLTVIIIASVLAGVLLVLFGDLRRDSKEQPQGKAGRTQYKEKGKPETKSHSIASPVSGRIAEPFLGESIWEKDSTPEQEALKKVLSQDRKTVVIYPAEDKLYAPCGGKITRLYPVGNAMDFRTEWGEEIYLQVAAVTDELLGRYFRPRIVQNEIVNKGKCLLEFDSQALAAEGLTLEVTLRLESLKYGTQAVLTAEGEIRAGEELFLVWEDMEASGTDRE